MVLERRKQVALTKAGKQKSSADDMGDTAEDASAAEQIIYSVFSELIDSPYLGKYLAYGIDAADERGCLLKRVHDITCDRQALDDLVERCNRFDLSLCHLDDVIEDFLC